jgi:hypothetical protein
MNEHGIDYPYFFVVDDPALKKKLGSVDILDTW